MDDVKKTSVESAEPKVDVSVDAATADSQEEKKTSVESAEPKVDMPVDAATADSQEEKKTSVESAEPKVDLPVNAATADSQEEKKTAKSTKTTRTRKKKADAEPVTKTKPVTKYEARLKMKYRDVIAGELYKEFAFKSPMQIPKLEKIVVSAGVGEAIANKKFLDSVVMELEQITGQKVVRTKASKSIANFKVRTGMEIGAKVTLRGNRMYEFLDRLLNIALPRVKDFRGVSPKAFDGRGNYSIGIDEQIIFPEIDYDKIEKVRGLNVAIITTASNDEQARSLLGKFGMPFRKE